MSQPRHWPTGSFTMAGFQDVYCPACNWSAPCGLPIMIDRLWRIGLVRRDTDADRAVIAALFNSSLLKLTCPDCGHVGLATRADDDDDEEAWGMARACEGCGAPIPRERLEVFPDTRLCVGCQAGDEQNRSAAVAEEYCSKCGSLMEVKLDRRGITRYQLRCPECGRQ